MSGGMRNPSEWVVVPRRSGLRADGGHPGGPGCRRPNPRTPLKCTIKTEASPGRWRPHSVSTARHSLGLGALAHRTDGRRGPRGPGLHPLTVRVHVVPRQLGRSEALPERVRAVDALLDGEELLWGGHGRVGVHDGLQPSAAAVGLSCGTKETPGHSPRTASSPAGRGAASPERHVPQPGALPGAGLWHGAQGSRTGSPGLAVGSAGWETQGVSH